MLQQAKMDWIDQTLLERGVPMWVLDYLKEEDRISLKVISAIAWLDTNGYAIIEQSPHLVRLLYEGKVISTFVSEVS